MPINGHMVVIGSYDIPGEKQVAALHDNTANVILCLDFLTGDLIWGIV